MLPSMAVTVPDGNPAVVMNGNDEGASWTRAVSGPQPSGRPDGRPAPTGPADGLCAEELTRYSRHLILPGVGLAGQRRLKAARVLVVGAGGLGSPALLYLAAAGVGTLGVVDGDVVEVSNLQRQVLHGVGDLGRPKVDSAADAVAAVNPHVRVVRHGERLTRANALDVTAGYDLVLDGTDSFPSRYLISDACSLLGLPCVWGSVYRFDGQVSVFWSRPPEGLAAVTYRDLFPEPPPPGAVPSCAEGGVFGVLCAAIGSAMAAEAIKLICGIGEPLLGRLLVHDGLAATWRELRVRPGASAPVTALEDDYPAFCGLAVGDPADPGDLREPGGSGGSVSPRELASMLRRREAGELDFVLVDVREPGEREIVAIPGAVSLPIGGFRTGEALAELQRIAAGRPVLLHCKSGSRSAEALALARAAGVTGAAQVAGGVLAWIDEVDPGLPRY